MIIVLAVFTIACSFSAEGNHVQKKWKATEIRVVNDFDGFSISVKEGSLSPQGLTLVFTNQSGVTGVYGEGFFLEKKIDGEWYEVPVQEEEYGFPDIGYELPPNETEDFTIDWEWLYGTLEAGEYRIVIQVLNVREPGDYDNYYLSAEFNIKTERENNPEAVGKLFIPENVVEINLLNLSNGEEDLFDDSEIINTILDELAKAIKVEGIVDMSDPQFQIQLVDKYKAIQTYYLWLGKLGEKSTLMRTENTHEIYTVSSSFTNLIRELIKEN